MVMLPMLAAGQESDKFVFRGYLSYMQTLTWGDLIEDLNVDNVLHNRINLFWYPAEDLSMTLQFRNRILYGDNFVFYDNYASLISRDEGYVDATRNLLDGNRYAVNISIDRLWLQYSLGNFEVKAGRQRINWGRTFVWNPNDIFNAYSFFDVDYPERPGSDALRLTYYPGISSSIELAAKVDHEERITAAMIGRFNVWNTDFQLMAGVVDQEDYVGGLGWSGYAGGLSIRGEASYFHPIDSFQDTTGQFVASISLDYTFSNSLYLQGEFLYNEQKGEPSLAGGTDFYNMSLSARELSFTEYNLFVQASYPVNPLLNLTLAGIYYPDADGYFIGPSATFSVKEDLDLSAFIQLFNVEMEFDTQVGKFKRRIKQNYVHARLKWNF